MLEQGPSERGVIENAFRRKQPIPTKIANAPELSEGMEIFYLAFLELTTCRMQGFATGEIPWDKIIKYAEVNEFDQEMTDDLLFFTRCLDRAYLDYVEKEQKKKSKESVERTKITTRKK